MEQLIDTVEAEFQNSMRGEVTSDEIRSAYHGRTA